MQVQQQLTRTWSTLRYRMEYGGYLSNHLLHGVVALFDLGASEEKIEEFAECYSTKLEKAEPSHDDVMQPDVRAKFLKESKLAFESAKGLLGKRQNFDGLLALYAAEVQELGIDKAVKKHLPVLVGGLAGALLHAIIQLGYAYHIGGERLVAEGLTYMHYAYLSFDEPQQVNAEELQEKKTFSRDEAMQLVRMLNGNDFLLNEMSCKLQAKPLVDLEIGGIQKRLSTMSGDPERGSSEAFNLIWDAINAYNLSKMNGVFALDVAFWLYMMIEHNDFVILHAVTSAWALQQVEHLLEPKDHERAWKVWLHVSLSRTRDRHSKVSSRHTKHGAAHETLVSTLKCCGSTQQIVEFDQLFDFCVAAQTEQASTFIANHVGPSAFLMRRTLPKLQPTSTRFEQLKSS
ncbi:hypothetical protein AM587_10002401 [Phytophthora nicotianae]|uniref:Uncharacterized protein n=1 Tax=Phytophthora nicotianae TaxID=4792 RepID=A0A0W8CIZ6_PHYNI|nr:hypothetical protein AM587_10002401 [Phytophthora nicotianae]